MRARVLTAFVVAAWAAALSGCGGGTSFAPVSGTVMLDGKPLARAVVTFTPVPQPGSTIAGDSASGTTDEGGKYSLRTYTNKGWVDGAQVGKHKVSISRQETRGDGDRAITTERVPPKYNQASELTADIVSGTNQKDFDLKPR